MAWGYSYKTGKLVECDQHGWAYDQQHGQCAITSR